jgi:thioredoxin-related protein
MTKNKQTTKMKKSIIATLMFSAVYLATIAQGKGIQFKNASSWQEIRKRAKAEHKCVFVDCYTTWCGPCKAMDDNVYSNDSVAQVVNHSFIALKLQMDVTSNDNNEIREHYTDAKKMDQEYHITAFPTLLFFSPDGELIYRKEGYQGPNDFIALVKVALDPDNQYTTFARKYQSNKTDYANARTRQKGQRERGSGPGQNHSKRLSPRLPG